jgi:hypothetical protein
VVEVVQLGVDFKNVLNSKFKGIMAELTGRRQMGLFDVLCSNVVPNQVHYTMRQQLI